MCALLLLALLLTGANPLGGALRAILVLGVVSPLLLWAWQRRATWQAHAPHGVALLAVLALALALRLTGLQFGLPYFEQPDEWATADRAIAMVQTGNFVPPSFTYPPLYTYMQAGMVALHFLWGSGQRLYASVADISPALYYPWGRALTGLMGTLGVLLTYGLAWRLYSPTVALLAALLLALFPLHVRDSRYITTDIPVSVLATLALLVCALLMQTGDGRRETGDRRRETGDGRQETIREGREGFSTQHAVQSNSFVIHNSSFILALAAGMCVGLTLATKYTPTSLLWPLGFAVACAAWARPTAAERLRAGLGLALLAVAGVGLGFTLGNPFWLPALPQLLNDTGGVLRNYRVAQATFNWAFYWGIFTQHGWLLAWLGVVGTVWAALRRSRADVLLLLFALPYFVQIANVPVVFFRNALPLLPVFFVFAALPLAWVLQFVDCRLQITRIKIAAFSGFGLLLVLLLWQPATMTLAQSYGLTQPTTRMRATAWVEQNVPTGSRIWLEDQTLILPPERYRVAGGSSILGQPPEWYAANGFQFLVANVSRTPAAQQDEVRALAERAGQLFRSSEASFGEEFAVLDTARLANAPPPTRVDRVLNSQVTLAAFQHPPEVRAGQTLPLALFWRCTEQIWENATVFVHLVDAQGNKVAQRDVPPLEGTRPTSSWQPGEELRDDQDVSIPAEVPPGEYEILVGMYIPETLAPLNPTPLSLGKVRVVGP